MLVKHPRMHIGGHLRVRHRLKRREVRNHVRSEADEGSLVVHAVAVVGRTEDGDQLPVVLHLEAVGLHLVRAHQQGEPVLLQKRAGDVRPKRHLRVVQRQRQPVVRQATEAENGS